jgi:hypothetical protein
MYGVSVSTAITLLQYKAGSTNTAKLIRAWVTQSNQTSSTQQTIAILRKSAAATVTSFTPLLLDPGDSAAAGVGGTSATGYTATAEGTNGNILVQADFNVLNGWLWVPVPEDRIIIPPSGIIGLTLINAPGSAMTIDAGLIIGEEG